MTIVDRDARGVLDLLMRRDGAVARSAQVRAFRAGETIYESDQMANQVTVVLGGRVQLYRKSRDGRRFVLATLVPGCMFGEESLLGANELDTFAVCLEPATLWTMPGPEAREFSATDAVFGFGLLQAMGQRLKEAEDRLEMVAYSTVASRLAALLLELEGDNPGLVVTVSHQELADMLGTWRETISKTLRGFRRRGLVSSGRRRLMLLDHEGLQELSGIA